MPTTILMYHGVSATGGGPSNPHCLSERTFGLQMRHLKDSGRAVVPWNGMTTPAPADSRVVGITFDDGNASDIGCSRILATLSYSALFFVPTEYIGRDGRLAKADIADLWRRGMGIGSHGHRHAPLAHLTNAELVADLTRSKAILEDILGARVEHLSFPAGSYDRRVLATAREVGYARFYTSGWGSNADREMAAGVLRRMPIVAGLGLDALDRMLDARYRRRNHARYYVKEFAKRALGERTYLRMRRALVNQRTIAD
jgi:peptidoglycan/xylan/chitin deacetylase (PgdA/CDA1 family)